MLGYLILTLLQIADSSSHHATKITKIRKSVHMNVSEKSNMVICSSGALCNWWHGSNSYNNLQAFGFNAILKMEPVLLLHNGMAPLLSVCASVLAIRGAQSAPGRVAVSALIPVDLVTVESRVSTE